MVIIQVRTHNYDFYILEQPSSWSTSWICPSWPRSKLKLSLLLVSLSKCIFCCHASPSILLSGWLLTDVQVHTHEHTCIHHIGITILLPFYTSSTLLGRPAGPDPSCLIQVEFVDIFQFENHSGIFSKYNEKFWFVKQKNKRICSLMVLGSSCTHTTIFQVGSL